jgi:hypothetical protein
MGSLVGLFKTARLAQISTKSVASTNPRLRMARRNHGFQPTFPFKTLFQNRPERQWGFEKSDVLGAFSLTGQF